MAEAGGGAVFDATVLIVAYDSRDTMPELAAALDAQTLRPAAIRVLENGSSPEGRLDPGTLPAGAELIVSEDNLGFAGGNNRIAAGCATRWLILLNPDAFPDPDWIEQLAAGAARHPEAGLFGSTQRLHGEPGKLDGAGDVMHVLGFNYRGAFRQRMDAPPDGETFAPCGAAMMIRRALFERLGGFDERFFCYVEDTDLGWRARLLGERAVQLQRAQVSHVGYKLTGRRSAFATYHGARNRIWMLLKCMSWPHLALVAPVNAALTLILWAGAARRGHFCVFGRALRDAFADWKEVAAERARVQADRRISAWEDARAMAWNPLRLADRKPDLRTPD